MKKKFFILGLFIVTALSLFGIYKIIKRNDGTPLLLLETQVSKEILLEDIKNTNGNYRLGGDEEMAILKTVLIRIKTDPGELSLVKSKEDAFLNTLMQKSLAKSNIDYFSKISKEDEQYLIFKNILPALAFMGGDTGVLSSDDFFVQLDSKLLTLKVNEERFSVPFHVLDAFLSFDVVKEGSEYKLDFLTPILNCNERDSYFSFLTRTNFFKVGTRPYLILEKASNCFYYGNATTTVTLGANIFSIKKDVTFPSEIKSAGWTEFLMMYVLSADIRDDIISYFLGNFSKEKINPTFMKEHFPESILQKYFKDDYKLITTYEYSSKDINGKEVKAKPYRSLAVDFLLAITLSFSQSYNIDKDGTLKTADGKEVKKESVYSQLLVDEKGNVVYPFLSNYIGVPVGVGPSLGLAKVYFKEDGKFESVDLKYYFNPGNCYRDGPQIYTLFGVQCGYSSSAFHNINQGNSSKNSVVLSVSTKEMDAEVKSILSNSRAQAEIYFDDNSNSYKGVCQSPKGIEPLLLEAGAVVGAPFVKGNTTVSSVASVCHDDPTAWAATVPLKTGIQPKSFWCVDSSGRSAFTIALPSIATICP